MTPIAYEKVRRDDREPVQEQEGEVVDLMAALRESVERTKKQRKGTAKREAS